MRLPTTVRDHLATIGKLGGSKNTEAQRKARKINGRKAGLTKAAKKGKA